VTHVLHYLHYYKEDKSVYYNQMVDILNKSGIYDVRSIKSLRKQIKHWDTVAHYRNEYSHESSPLFKYDFNPSDILNQYGMPIYYEDKELDHKKRKNIIIQNYKNLSTLNSVMKDFVSKYPKRVIII